MAGEILRIFGMGMKEDMYGNTRKKGTAEGRTEDQ